MLVECTNCAAPLDAKQGATVVKCRYCNHRNVLQQARQIAGVTPPQWQPPRVWTPPAHVPAPSNQQLKYHGRATGCAVLLPVFFGLLIPGIAVFMGTGGSGWLKVKMWDGRSTLVCDLNEKLTIEGVKATVSNGAVIEARANCKIKIRKSRLRGETGVTAGVNADVQLVDTKIKADSAAIETGGNAKISVRGGKLTSKEVALRLGNNDEVSLTKVTVEGKEAAISNSMNLKLKLRDSKLKANEYGVRGGSNVKMEMRDSTITTRGTGIHVEANFELRLRGNSKISADRIGIRTTVNSDIDIDGATVEARQTAIEGSHNAEVRCRAGSIRGARAFALQHNAKLHVDDCKVEGAR